MKLKQKVQNWLAERKITRKYNKCRDFALQVMEFKSLLAERRRQFEQINNDIESCIGLAMGQGTLIQYAASAVAVKKEIKLLELALSGISPPVEYRFDLVAPGTAASDNYEAKNYLEIRVAEIEARRGPKGD